MSNEELAYANSIAPLLTDDERNVAHDMHVRHIAILEDRLGRRKDELIEAENEVREAEAALNMARERLNRIDEDWHKLGPNTAAFVTQNTRQLILEGMPYLDDQTGEFKVIDATYEPDGTREAWLKGARA